MYGNKVLPLKIKIIFFGFLGVFIVIINVVPIQLNNSIISTISMKL